MTHVNTQYIRLYRAQPNYRWWRPLLAILLAGVFVLSVGAMIAIAAGLLLAAALGQLPSPTELDALFAPDVARPLSVFISLGSVAIWIPLIFFAMWAVGLNPLGMIHSIALRIRWRKLYAFAGIAAVIVVLTQLVTIVGSLIVQQAPVEYFPVEYVPALLSLAAVLVLVPFQAAAEEYAFRGLLLQTLGSWISRPVIPILLTSVLFMLPHAYNVWGMLEVFLLGLTAGVLTHKTNGLEAAIALHVINNVVVFVTLLTGVFGTTSASASLSSPVSLAITTLMLAAYATWILKSQTRAQKETQ